MGIKSIRIQNYKSIKDSGEIFIKPINVLIGSNGVGKSNFIGFFKLLNKIYLRELELFIAQYGQADNFLYFGRKESSFLSGEIKFDNDFENSYEFKMVPDQNNRLIFLEEWSNFVRQKTNRHQISSGGNLESKLKEDDGYRNKYLLKHFRSFRIFHFHDTSISSGMKQASSMGDYAYLYEDASNLAAFLYFLQEKHSSYFKTIVAVIKSIAPFFGDFFLQPDEINDQYINLRWREHGSDQLFNAHNLSDGSLRMICLTTLLLQPNPPGVIIIDEPELGLHPFAITKLAAMLKSVSSNSQVIISTQSINLLNQFSAEDVIVVERQNKETIFTRQDSRRLKSWLKDYSLGELWDKNILGGRP